jgi:hypothetical protein
VLHHFCVVLETLVAVLRVARLFLVAVAELPQRFMQGMRGLLLIGELFSTASCSGFTWSHPSFACNFARRSSVHCPQISEGTFFRSSSKRSSLQTMVSTFFVHLRFPSCWARCGVAWAVKSWQDQCLCRSSGVGAAGSPHALSDFFGCLGAAINLVAG